MQCPVDQTQRSSKPRCQDCTETYTLLAQHLGQADLKEVDVVKPRCPSTQCNQLEDIIKTNNSDHDHSGRAKVSDQAHRRKMSMFSDEFEGSSESVSQKSSDELVEDVNADLNALEKSPLASIINLDRNAKCFKLRSCAGLSGDEVVAEFTCALSANSDNQELSFFVYIGSTALSYFDKHTFMNLAERAEQNGAKQVVFLLDAEHVELKGFRHTFKVLDADRVPSSQLQAMLKPELIAKEVQQSTKFYQMHL